MKPLSLFLYVGL